MYPILMRLADRGMPDTDWETDRVPGRPPRHLYRVAGAGLAYAGTVHLPTAPHPVARSRPQLRGA
jgi:DNA-binding PadR family transcriptional regulator